MQDNIVLIIFLILFFVLPSVMKLLGRRAPGRGNEPEEKDAPVERDEAPAHPFPGTGREPYGPDFSRSEDYGASRRPEISDKPIHPKWF